MEDRLKFFETGDIPKKNVDVMTEAMEAIKKEEGKEIHSVQKREIYSHRKNISWNQLFTKSLDKKIIFTKFLSKKCENKFL